VRILKTLRVSLSNFHLCSVENSQPSQSFPTTYYPYYTPPPTTTPPKRRHTQPHATTSRTSLLACDPPWPPMTSHSYSLSTSINAAVVIGRYITKASLLPLYSAASILLQNGRRQCWQHGSREAVRRYCKVGAGKPGTPGRYANMVNIPGGWATEGSLHHWKFSKGYSVSRFA
jgi:hypothetical protein